MWGDVVIQGLWSGQVEAIIDVIIGDSGVDSYKYEPMEALLFCWKTIENYKHGKNCNEQRKHFFSFVLSVDGIIGRETLVVLV